jgi:hypothetical protein
VNKKEQQLGMKIGTASHKLRRAVMFSLLVKLNLDICSRCSEKLQENNYSMDHVVDWLDSDKPVDLFFDINNISFSHKLCNSKAGKRPHKKYTSSEEKHEAQIQHQRNWRRINKDKYKVQRKDKYLRRGT